MTKSDVPLANAPIKIYVLAGQPNATNESQPCLKCGRPVNSKDRNPRTKLKGNMTWVRYENSKRVFWRNWYFSSRRD